MTTSNLSKRLIDYLKQVPDERNASGQRHPIWLILLIIIMGMLSGYGGDRSLGRFVERHRRQLISTLKIEQARVASYSIIRRVMMNLDYLALAQVFNEWAWQYTHNHKGQWIALDGKSLKNSVSEGHSAQ